MPGKREYRSMSKFGGLSQDWVGGKKSVYVFLWLKSQKILRQSHEDFVYMFFFRFLLPPRVFGFSCPATGPFEPKVARRVRNEFPAPLAPRGLGSCGPGKLPKKGKPPKVVRRGCKSLLDPASKKPLLSRCRGKVN